MAVSLTACSCPSSFDLMICAKCGGTLSTNTMLSRLDDGTVQWFSELDSDGRLYSALANYASIDRQIRRGIPATAMLQTLTQTITGPGGLSEEIESNIARRFEELRCENENSTKLLREIVSEQVGAIVGEIKGLVEQGKSIADIESRIREATGALQTYLTAIRVPSIRGDEGEINVIRELQEAVIGQTCFKVEPIGGADATDAIVHFYQAGVAVGGCLIEVKSSSSWSNEFVEQVRIDMKRYNIALAILAVNRLPKSAKGRGFHIDAEVGMLVISSPEIVAPIVGMFYEISSSNYRLQQHTLDLQSLAAKRDLVYYVNDNMKILEDCKKASDIADDAARKIKAHLADIGSRLQENNRRIALVLSGSHSSAKEDDGL
jgi:hypothetical protein